MIKCDGRPGWISVVLFAGAVTSGCGQTHPRMDGSVDPGKPVAPSPSVEEAAERARVTSALSAVAHLGEAGLAAQYPADFATTLGYDPRAATNLSLIRNSALGLSAAEENILGRQGFVISDRQRFPTFTYGYSNIYADHLPLFVSADSLLYAVHRSYDEMLKQLELTSLRPALSTLLKGMRLSLKEGKVAALGGEAARDIDLYLAVALSLLEGNNSSPVAGASSGDIGSLIAKAMAAQGAGKLSLFGVTREEDFSQYTPRGHYTDSPDLTAYFKAMMWLGRTDLRLIETQKDGTQVFRRRQFDGALGLAALVDGPLTTGFTQLDDTIAAFVGESDNMRVTDFPALLRRLGATELSEVPALDDATIAEALVEGNFGAQRISSHIMINGMAKGTLPLSRTFLLLGQRYVVDSHVFSNVVYDRVGGGGTLRMMPNPLDVAFAVFGNNQARVLLGDELAQHHYASDLAAMRVLVEDHGETFWDANLYNGWLRALRSLSRGAGAQSTPLEVAGTSAWARRTLNTQLASWAELRHDTILYAKQSFTAGPSCEFPDALVEPNPTFFASLQSFAAKGQQVVQALGLTAESDYFVHLGSVAGILKEMSEYQAQGTPFTAAHMAFINETVTVQAGCGAAFASGWYPKLFFHANPTEFSPTIADVHTQPKDEGGNDIGRVLHVGTGYARLMLVTANTCTGPRAYAGLASSYFEEITDNYKRLDDLTWSARFGTKGVFGWNDNGASPAPDVPWLTDLIAR